VPVITISRQFGSAGVAVARALAERFDAELLDRAIVAQAAVRAGIPESDLESYDERLPTFWQRIAHALSASSPEPSIPVAPSGEHMSHLSLHDQLVTVTRQVIEEAAERGNAVILGRGAAFILGRRPDTTHVQLHASIEARLRYLLARADELPADARPDEASLRELCHSIDSARANYIRAIYKVDWLDARHYDLSVDSGRLGIDRTVDLIAQVAAANATVEQDR
jgi:cytidylate kinase